MGKGSDEVLALLFPAFFKGKKIAFADITYSFYSVYCSLFEVSYELLPLPGGFFLRSGSVLRRPRSGYRRGAPLQSQRAHRGRICCLLKEVERILSSNEDKLIAADEAYIDFGGETAAGIVNRYPNLIVTQTLSKSRQLAGMRVGLAIASKPLIAGLNAVKNSFNSYTADRLAIAAARASFEDTLYFEQTRAKIIQTRQRTAEELEALGFDIIPSAANFIFAKPVGIGAADLFQALREEGILVRYFDRPRIGDRLRISIGTDEEMDRLISAVKKILGQ